MVSAFSLIELMVVIAIVAVLSAVAVPAYSDYVIKAKLQSALAIVNANDTTIQEFYNRVGRFPHTINDLNFPSTLDVSNPNYPPYIIMYAGDASVTTGTQCRNGYYYSYFVNYDGGNLFADSVGRAIVYYNYFIDVNGTIQKYCAYQEADPNGAVVRDIIPGCEHMTGLITPSDIQNVIDTGCT